MNKQLIDPGQERVARRNQEEAEEGQGEWPCTALLRFAYLVLHEQNEPCHHNVDCIPQARILEQFGNLTSRETRKEQS